MGFPHFECISTLLVRSECDGQQACIYIMLSHRYCGQTSRNPQEGGQTVTTHSPIDHIAMSTGICACAIATRTLGNALNDISYNDTTAAD